MYQDSPKLEGSMNGGRHVRDFESKPDLSADPLPDFQIVDMGSVFWVEHFQGCAPGQEHLSLTATIFGP